MSFSARIVLAGMIVAAPVGASRQVELTWSSNDGGGGVSRGGGFELACSIGQHDSGAAIGDDFECRGGYWVGSGGANCALADFDCDGVVDGTDLGILLGYWGACPGCAADLNGDGIVNGTDLAVLLGSWG